MNRPKLMAPKHFLLLTTGVPAAIVVLLVAFSVPQPSESAYTFQKINSMLPEMRQFFG
jgi:hypothetical protein